MRINNTNPAELVSQTTSANPRRPSPRAREDQAQISLAARFATDSAKADRLAAAVAAGTYRVSAFDLAGSMIDEMIASARL